MALTRREFLLIGVATGATAAVGVVLPLTRLAGETVSGTPTLVPGRTTSTSGPGAVVGLFPKVRIAGVADVSLSDPITFQYPLEGQHNVLIKLGQAVPGGVGPDEDIVSYSSVCTHMGCVLTEYKPDYRALGPCPCHFSTFDLAHDGMVSLGQATQNLPRVLLSLEDDDVYATGVLRLVYGFQNTLEGAPFAEVEA